MGLLMTLARTALVFGLCGIALAAPASAAQDGALVGLHDLRREGNKTCMVGHFHTGSGNGNSRGQAEGAAARSWSEFTGWEYGGHWGSPSLAASKSMKCSQGASGWSCEFEARACKK
jgi:hypothetical protein